MYPRIYGRPDFLVNSELAIFCDSEFWHGRKWSLLKERLKRGSNPDYWVAHIESNRRRDRIVNAKLNSQGYKVLRLWSSEIYKKPQTCLRRVASASADMRTTALTQIGIMTSRRGKR